MAESNWTLQEQLLLLCLEPRTGEIHQRHFRYMLSGAALADLLRHKRIAFEIGRVQVRQVASIGDRAIDDAFLRLSRQHRPEKLSYWVRNLYTGQNETVKTLGERLTERGVLTAEDHRALWVMRWTTYPVLEPAHVQKLHRQIQTVIREDTPVSEVSPDLAILISLLHYGKALDRILSTTEIYEREQRIAAIVASDAVAYAVGKALSDTLLEEEMEKQRAAGTPVVVVRPPRHGRPPHHRHGRRRAAPFPGPRPDRHGVWSVEVENDKAEEEDSTVL